MKCRDDISTKTHIREGESVLALSAKTKRPFFPLVLSLCVKYYPTNIRRKFAGCYRCVGRERVESVSRFYYLNDGSRLPSEVGFFFFFFLLHFLLINNELIINFLTLNIF